MKKRKITRDQAVRFSIFIILGILAIFFVLPYIWMILNSFKSTKEILMSPKNIFPEEFTLAGYEKVLTQSPFFTWFKNSAFITVTNTVVILFVSALVGYVFSKFEFRFKNVLFIIVLATMMVPAQTTMIPSFLLISKLGLYNTAGALILPSFVNAFGIYLCKQFCDEIPKEIIESAKLDGASDIKIFFKIVMPMIRPALGALAIFTFLTYWNDYLNPLIMLSEVKKMTLPLALSFFAQQHMADLSAQMAASALIMVPVTIVFMAFQKQFIKGIAMTGMK
ncbi:carbohydrate ABC transporter permease [Breznakia pachnodae]|uniref:Multiple sugar transport system permease protein n=1 Tax=Breznakia pachnodae TaxID=265178 RepID=A0ABU0E280_9FIRM|nr:carbohydrate ABC transporter permease [Breznakia pachnodae]MDQ0360988.1 multiple sugar transport system permease protein [Breznakia pachnodae]